MKNIEQNLQNAEGLLTGWNREAIIRNRTVWISLSGGYLRPAVKALHNAHWGYLSAITGMTLDRLQTKWKALYHFCNGAAMTTLRVRLPRDGRQFCRPSKISFPRKFLRT